MTSKRKLRSQPRSQHSKYGRDCDDSSEDDLPRFADKYNQLFGKREGRTRRQLFKVPVDVKKPELRRSIVERALLKRSKKVTSTPMVKQQKNVPDEDVNISPIETDDEDALVAPASPKQSPPKEQPEMENNCSVIMISSTFTPEKDSVQASVKKENVSRIEVAANKEDSRIVRSLRSRTIDSMQSPSPKKRNERSLDKKLSVQKSVRDDVDGDQHAEEPAAVLRPTEAIPAAATETSKYGEIFAKVREYVVNKSVQTSKNSDESGRSTSNNVSKLARNLLKEPVAGSSMVFDNEDDVEIDCESETEMDMSNEFSEADLLRNQKKKGRKSLRPWRISGSVEDANQPNHYPSPLDIERNPTKLAKRSCYNRRKVVTLKKNDASTSREDIKRRKSVIKNKSHSKLRALEIFDSLEGNSSSISNRLDSPKEQQQINDDSETNFSTKVELVKYIDTIKKRKTQALLEREKSENVIVDDEQEDECGWELLDEVLSKKNDQVLEESDVNDHRLRTTEKKYKKQQKNSMRQQAKTPNNNRNNTEIPTNSKTNKTKPSTQSAKSKSHSLEDHECDEIVESLIDREISSRSESRQNSMERSKIDENFGVNETSRSTKISLSKKSEDRLRKSNKLSKIVENLNGNKRNLSTRSKNSMKSVENQIESKNVEVEQMLESHVEQGGKNEADNLQIIEENSTRNQGKKKISTAVTSPHFKTPEPRKKKFPRKSQKNSTLTVDAETAPPSISDVSQRTGSVDIISDLIIRPADSTQKKKVEKGKAKRRKERENSPLDSGIGPSADESSTDGAGLRRSGRTRRPPPSRAASTFHFTSEKEFARYCTNSDFKKPLPIKRRTNARTKNQSTTLKSIQEDEVLNHNNNYEPSSKLPENISGIQTLRSPPEKPTGKKRKGSSKSSNVKPKKQRITSKKSQNNRNSAIANKSEINNQEMTSGTAAEPDSTLRDDVLVIEGHPVPWVCMEQLNFTRLRNSSVSVATTTQIPNDGSCSGVLKMPIGAKKPTKVAPEHNQYFIVLKGVAAVTVEDKTMVIASSGRSQFMIPRGHEYSIDNASDTEELQIYFVQFKSSI